MKHVEKWFFWGPGGMLARSGLPGGQSGPLRLGGSKVEVGGVKSWRGRKLRSEGSKFDPKFDGLNVQSLV